MNDPIIKYISESIASGIFIYHGEKTVYVNQAALSICGYSREEVFSMHFWDLIHPDMQETVKELGLKRQTQEDNVPPRYEVKLLTKEGETKWVDYIASNTEFKGKPAVIGNIIEITERKQMESQSARKSIIMEAVNQIFKKALTCKTEDELGKTCLAVCEELTKSKFGFIGEVNQTGLFDTIAISNPGWDVCKMPGSEAVKAIKDMKIRGIDRSTIKEEKSRIVNDPSTHPDSIGPPEGHPQITSFLGVPLKEAGRTIGMIGLGNKESGYDLADKEAVETLSVAIVEAMRRKRAEASLRESEERFRTLTKMSPVGIFLADTDGHAIYWNDRLYEITGMSEDEAMGTGWANGVHPEDRERIFRKWYEKEQEIFSLREEYRFVNRDGQVTHVIAQTVPLKDYRGQVTGYVGTITDITERKQAEAKLKESEERLRMAMSAAEMGTWWWDTVTNQDTRDANFNRILGLEAAESTQPVEDFIQRVHPEDSAETEQEIKRSIRERDMYLAEFRIVRPDGTERWLRDQGLPYYDEQNIISYMTGAVVDITDRKQAENKLRKSQEQLRSLSAHLETVLEEERKNIAREMHDELGQILSALKVDVFMLDKIKEKGHTSLAEQKASMLELLEKAITTVQRISSKLRPDLLEHLGLTAAIEWETEEFQKRTGISCDVTFNPKTIILDDALSITLYRIFQEGLTNILRHAHATRVKVKLTRKQGKIELKIIDNGRGIAEKQISPLKSFGLIGIRERVAFLKGEAKIEGIQDKGTTITVSIPISKKEGDL